MPEVQTDKPKLALQTWTVRYELRANAEKTLTEIQNIGFEHLEVGGCGRMPLREFSECNKHRLKIMCLDQPPLTSEHFGILTDEIKRHADACGARYVTVMLDPSHRGSESTYLRYAKLCSRAGKELYKEGIKLCYRFYHYDLIPLKRSSHGKSGLDIFVEETSPQCLSFELNSYFINKAGMCYETVLDKCESRCKLFILCDVDDQGRQAILGKGILPWTDLMDSVKALCSPEYFIIENDTPGALPLIKESFTYASEHFL